MIPKLSLTMSRRTVTYKQGDGEKYRDNKTVKQVITGADVTEIAENAFYKCSNLAAVELGRDCKKIGQGAFCFTALREVFIPESVEEIGKAGPYGNGVFKGCSNLQKVVFEANNIKVIGPSAFNNTNMDTIELKEGVTTIGKYIFFNCSNLSTLVWPTSITSVEEHAFNGCTKLHELAGSDNQDDVIAYLKASPLFAQLCIAGKFEEVKRAAEVDAEVVEQRDAGGRTPLSSICQHGSSEEILKWLLEKNPEAAKEKDKDGNKLLHIMYGNSKRTYGMVKHLLEAYPDVEKEENIYGLTPLDVHDGVVLVYKQGAGRSAIRTRQ